MAIYKNRQLNYLLPSSVQLLSYNGKPLTGGHVRVYLAGTATKYITYQDWDETENQFDILIPNDGRIVALAETNKEYDYYVYDSYGNLVFSRLNVSPNAAGDISIEGQLTSVENSDGNLDITNQLISGVNHFDVNLSQDFIDSKVDEAPINGKQYARKDASWVVVEAGGGGGTTYTSGNGINIDSDNVINVLAGNGLEFDANNKLQVKLGKGLKFDTEAGIEGEISIDDIGQEVIAEVQELASELDKKITTTFNYAQIKDMQDFAPYGVTGTTRLIGQLFAVPIASEIRKDETLLNVRALQNYSGKISFGIFEFDFEGNEGTGSTTWLCDTGVVSIKAGENQMPVKHIKSTSTSEPKIKMMPGKLYYATVLIAGDAPATGLMLAADDPYEANYNATPKYTMIASNMDNYVDWSNGSQEATWFQGYNEFHNVPRLFMMIRNGEAAPVPTVDPFRNYDAFTLNHNTTVQDVFSLNIVPTNYPMIYQKIIPLEDVTITKVGWCDTNEQAVYDYYTDIPVMLNNTYTGIANFNNDMSTSLIDGTHYFHQCTLTNPVALQKGVIYWVPALAKIDDANEAITTYTTPANTTKDLVLFTSKWNISQWAIAGGYGEYKNTQPAPMCRITTEDGRAFTF